jgi:hypothetical protein
MATYMDNMDIHCNCNELCASLRITVHTMATMSTRNLWISSICIAITGHNALIAYHEAHSQDPVNSATVDNPDPPCNRSQKRPPGGPLGGEELSAAMHSNHKIFRVFRFGSSM